jgi:hypothetical protein
MKTHSYIGRTKELRIFGDLISKEPSLSNILFVSGEAGMGKTRLLMTFIDMCKLSQISNISIDLRDSNYSNLLAILTRTCESIGWERFSNFNAQVNALIKSPQIDLMGSSDIQMVLGGFDSNDRHAYKFFITDSFFSDLASIASSQKIVMFFDDYEQSGPEMQEWFTGIFLPLVAQTKGLVVVIAGRYLPEPQLEWVDSLVQIKLRGLTAEEWLEYAKQSNINIGSSAILELYRVLEGNPLYMVMALSSFDERAK